MFKSCCVSVISNLLLPFAGLLSILDMLGKGTATPSIRAMRIETIELLLANNNRPSIMFQLY